MDRARGWKRREYKAIIHGRRWARLRAAYIAAHPFCEECLKRGVLDRPAEEVHHKRPISSGRDAGEMLRLGYDWGNLEAVCHDCHEGLHKLLGSHKAKGRGAVSDGVAAFMRMVVDGAGITGKGCDD